jgi:hypothetical protein
VQSPICSAVELVWLLLRVGHHHPFIHAVPCELLTSPSQVCHKPHLRSCELRAPAIQGTTLRGQPRSRHLPESPGARACARLGHCAGQAEPYATSIL